MTKFKPGMTCPGWGSHVCTKVLDEREDLYEGRVLCHHCGREEQTFYQRENRKKTMHKCADCPKLCGARAERCGSCGQKYAKAQQQEAARRAKEAPKLPTVAFCPTGLRGPGGEWEHGPTNVQGWATLDWGRL